MAADGTVTNSPLRPGRSLRKAYNVTRDQALEWPGCSFCTRGTWRMDTAFSEDNAPACSYIPDHVDQILRYFGAVNNPPKPHHQFHHDVRAAFGLPCDDGCQTPQPPKVYAEGASLIESIKAIVRVEEIAGRLTKLKGHGDKLRGACPFHNERKGQSLTVYLETQSWYCFGYCAKGGDVVDLLRLADDQGLRWR